MSEYTHYFLESGGEMGSLMRHFNWEDTSLGTPDNWPRSLRTALGILLNSRFPMFIYWGPQYLCFYNDAYRPSLGDNGKHPFALGRPGEEIWPEIWDFNRPVLGDIMSGGKATWQEDQLLPIYRNGRLEDVYWTYSYSPIKGEARVEGVFVTCMETTAAVHSRHQLQESESRFRSLVHNTPDIITRWDTDCRLIYANSGFEEKTGVPNATLLGKTNQRMGQPEAIVLPYMAALQRVIETGQVSGHFNEFLTPKGTMYFHSRMVPEFGPDGKVQSVLAIARDITELHESETRFQNLLREATVGLIVLSGASLTVTVVNKAYSRVVGHTVETLLNRPIFETLPGAEAAFRPVIEQVMASGEPHHLNGAPYQVIDERGKPVQGFLNLVYQPYRETGGAITGVMVVVHDVTELVQSRQVLEEKEAALRNATDLAQLPNWGVDLRRNQALYSERMSEWLGSGNRPLALDNSSTIDEQDRDRVAAAFRKAIGSPGEGKFDEVYAIINEKTGQRRIIHAIGSVVFDKDGNALSINGTALDVTIQKELQQALENEVQLRTEELAAAIEELRATNEELAESNEQLLHSNEELAQYAYVASHDLQEPLRKIQIFSGMLSGKRELADDSRELADKIGQSTNRMTMLIRDLLEFSRLLKSDTLFRPTDLNEIAAAVYRDFELICEEKGAVLKLGRLPVVQAVGLQMNQLFYNLVSNALKFVKSSVVPEIDISAEEIPQGEAAAYVQRVFPFAAYWRICIRDNGIGFDTKYAEQIFEVF